MYDKVNYSAEFAKRTRSILQDCPSKEYEVTQLINSMVGLLIIPQQKEFNRIDESYIPGEMLDELRKRSNPSSVDFNTILRHMRNAVAHSRLTFIGERQNDSGMMAISKVKFKDKNPRDSKDFFEIELSVDELKDFLFEFTDSIIKKENNRD